MFFFRTFKTAHQVVQILPRDRADQNHVGFVLDQGVAEKIVLEQTLQLPVRRFRPRNGLDVMHHELLDRDAAQVLVAPLQLGQVRQLLDLYDALVDARRNEAGHGVRGQHRQHDGQHVQQLAGDLEGDDRRGNGVRHRPAEAGRPDHRVRSRHDPVRDPARFVDEALGRQECGGFPDQAAERGAQEEDGHEAAGGHGQDDGAGRHQEVDDAEEGKSEEDALFGVEESVVEERGRRVDVGGVHGKPGSVVEELGKCLLHCEVAGDVLANVKRVRD